MREKFNRFMQGRYGMDHLNSCLVKIFFVTLILSMFTGRIAVGAISLGRIFYWISLAVMVWFYYRTFSRNVYKRSEENQRFLRKTEGIRNFFAGKKNVMEQRKYYHIYTCPGCRQKIRIPKGKGKIEVRCPKCGKTFIKRS